MTAPVTFGVLAGKVAIFTRVATRRRLPEAEMFAREGATVMVIDVPQGIAAAALVSAGDDSPFLTDIDLPVDGGINV